MRTYQVKTSGGHTVEMIDNSQWIDIKIEYDPKTDGAPTRPAMPWPELSENDHKRLAQMFAEYKAGLHPKG